MMCVNRYIARNFKTTNLGRVKFDIHKMRLPSVFGKAHFYLLVYLHGVFKFSARLVFSDSNL